MARGSAGESVLQKHLRVLDAFDSLNPALSLADISRASGLPTSSTHRLVAELEREGLLERSPDRSYRLGLRLWEYASRTPGALGLRELARPWLTAVHNRVRQHTQLGVRSGSDVLFIERLSAPDTVVNATLIGGRIPLHASASGLVLLADAPPSVLNRMKRDGLRVFTNATVRTDHQLDEIVARVRSDGFADTPGHIHEESRGIAVPIRGSDGSVIAGLGVVVPNDGASPLPIVQVLKSAAAGVSRALGQAPVFSGVDHGHPVGGVSPRSWEYITALERAVPRHPLPPDGSSGSVAAGARDSDHPNDVTVS